jgi:hypothetical protein
MHRAILSTAALLTIAAANLSAAADDRKTCQDENNEDAVAACDRLIKRNPRDPVLYINRGWAYLTKIRSRPCEDRLRSGHPARSQIC